MYEGLLGLFRSITRPIVKKAFKRVVERAKDSEWQGMIAAASPSLSRTTGQLRPLDNEEIREFRQHFLQAESSGELAREIQKSIGIRRTLTNLCASSILAWFALFGLKWNWLGISSPDLGVSPMLVNVEFWLNTFILLVVVFGEFQRSWSLGKVQADAYVVSMLRQARR